jgi:two-component system, sensor histidine kinase and response regulator
MTHRVLVVEDNEASRELLSDWLEAGCFEVRSAGNLQQAFAAFEDQPPHAVLLDIQLGVEDGLRLAAWIRQQPEFRHIPVIAVTANAMLAQQEQVLKSGCNACVSKPVDFKLLDAQLRLWLDADPKLERRS